MDTPHRGHAIGVVWDLVALTSRPTTGEHDLITASSGGRYMRVNYLSVFSESARNVLSSQISTCFGTRPNRDLGLSGWLLRRPESLRKRTVALHDLGCLCGTTEYRSLRPPAVCPAPLPAP